MDDNNELFGEATVPEDNPPENPESTPQETPHSPNPEPSAPPQDDSNIPFHTQDTPSAQNPYAPPPQNPYAPPIQNPFAQPAQNPFAQPAQNPSQPPYYNANSPYGQPPVIVQELPGKGLGTAGLILGICSIVFSCAFLGTGLGIPGIIVSILSMSAAKKVGRKNSPALAGLILSIIGVVLFIILIIGTIVAAAMGYDYTSYSQGITG